MADKVLCEPIELYNILNQYHVASRLAETNYLYLIDARPLGPYYAGHIICAKNAKRDSKENFIMPSEVEIDCMRHIVVYDSNTSSLSDSGPAKDCAECLATASLYPVKILVGGYERFSAIYPFFRTQKIIYTIRELESLLPYPVEILPGQLYLGDCRQATSPHILKDLKLLTLISVSEKSSDIFDKENCSVMHVPVAESVDVNLYNSFEQGCDFIASSLNAGCAVLIFSDHGISRCAVLTMAFLMYHLKYTIKEAWDYAKQCKPTLRPNREFVQQLSNWELHLFGRHITDTSEPNYWMVLKDSKPMLKPVSRQDKNLPETEKEPLGCFVSSADCCLE